MITPDMKQSFRERFPVYYDVSRNTIRLEVGKLHNGFQSISLDLTSARILVELLKEEISVAQATNQNRDGDELPESERPTF